MLGVSRIGISKTEKENNQTVDAAKVNPAPKKRAKKIKIENGYWLNAALHIDRKGHGLIACCPFCVSGCCCAKGLSGLVLLHNDQISGARLWRVRWICLVSAAPRSIYSFHN